MDRIKREVGKDRTQKGRVKGGKVGDREKRWAVKGKRARKDIGSQDKKNRMSSNSSQVPFIVTLRQV